MAKKPRCPQCGSDSRVPDLVWTSCPHPWHQMAASPAPAQEPCVWRDISTAPKDGTWIVAVGRLRHDPRLLRACMTRWAQQGQPPVYAEGWSFSAPGYSDLFDPVAWLPAPHSTPSREDHSGDGSR